MSTKSPGPSRFADLPLAPSLIQVVAEMGFEELTPIQAASIPLLLKGQDLIGQSQTGSGKTAAYALPILHQLKSQQRTPQALILCPTRELCTQVAREMRKLGRRLPGLQVLIVSGGLPSGPQRMALEKGVHVVVGTPGRALDLLNRGKLELGAVKCLVLDEADRMLDMGFRDEIEEILRAMPETRQTVFFSATFPESIDEMSRTHQREPKRVTITATEKARPAIRQAVYTAEREEKPHALQQLLRHFNPEAALVFCNQKATVDELAAGLTDAGISASALHGGLEQFDRDRVLAKFRNHSIRVLVATDVAARGLDIENLDLVINFDLPRQPAVYTHRIGRTGRAGKGGFAISLVLPKDRAWIQATEEEAKCKLERLALPAGEKPRSAGGGDAAMETLCISGGRKDKIRPADILGALTGEAGGLAGSDIGKIEIHDRITYVAVAKKVAKVALAGLRNGRIKGKKFHVEPVT